MRHNHVETAPFIETGIDLSNWVQVSTWSRLLRCDYDDIISAVYQVGNRFTMVAQYINNKSRSS